MVHFYRTTLLTLSLFLFLACGPDTIFLRPALDTPQQHVKNGHNLLIRGKIDAAHAEFLRAKNLDQNYAPAYVGLALIQGHQGNIDIGFDLLDQAKARAKTPQDAQAVDQGYEQLRELQAINRN